MSPANAGELRPRPATNPVNLSRRERTEQLRSVLDEHFATVYPRPRFPYRIVGEKLLGLHRHWRHAPSGWAARPGDDTPARFLHFLRSMVEHYEPSPHFARSFTGKRRLRNTLEFDWYLHVATGNNIRTAHGLPFPLSKRAAHLVNEAPPELTIRGALRWAQLVSFGLGEYQAELMIAHRCFDPHRAASGDPFWDNVAVRIARADVDAESIPYLLDYLRDQRRRNADFAMAKRPIGKLLVDCYRWQRSAEGLRNTRRLERLQRRTKWENRPQGSWLGCDTIAPLHKSHPEIDDWRIVEVTTVADLFIEGKAMRHCVASWKGYCMRGAATVWSVQQRTGAGVWHRRATIDIDPGTKRMVEFKAQRNRRPGAETQDVVRLWAKANALKTHKLLPETE